MITKYLKHFAILLFSSTAGIGVVDVAGTLSQGLAQTQNRLVFNRPLRTNRPSRPGSLIGRGTRRPNDELCGKTALPLTALVPYVPKPSTEKNPYPHRVLGLTMSATPTFWFYVPYQPKGRLTGVFTIREQVNDKLKAFHEQAIVLPSSPGLFAIQLKDKTLAPGQTYQWVFSVECVPNAPSGNDIVVGWVEYESNPEVNRELQRATTLQQKIFLYAQNGIWHETITTLANDLCVSDRKQAQIWFKDLMQSIDLTEIATKAPSNLLQNCPKL